jgi:hypothetical protein
LWLNKSKPMAKNTALVAGALGVVVRASMTSLADKPDWDVIGFSRRAPDFQTATRFLQLDLTVPLRAATPSAI